jgi:hypothetical protein
VKYLYITKKQEAMKKIILSLGALLAVSIASAQSYPKQPDRTIVNYVPYQKAPETDKVKEAEVKMDANGQKATTPLQPAIKDDKLKKGDGMIKNNKTSVAAAEPKN